jgi:SAM-dependent methyltransferase
MFASVPLTISTAAQQAIRSRFAEIGYDERRCSARLGIENARDTVRRIIVRHRVGARDAFLADPSSPLDTLISLFLFREPQPSKIVLSTIGREAVDAMQSVGLVRSERSDLAATALIFPCQSLLVVTDILPTKAEALAAGNINRVMVLFPESYDLAAVTARRVAGRALDLGTGSGVHALLASRHADTVLGVDINPRAVAVARFNARLNGVKNVRFALGDAFDSTAEDERHDLITVNLPWVPDPTTAAGTNYWSGGETGEAFLPRVFREVPQRLNDRGLLHVACLFVHRHRDPLKERVKQWLDWPHSWLDVLVTRSSIDAWSKLLRGSPSLNPDELLLLESWTRQGVTGFSFGVVHARPAPSKRPPFLVEGAFGDIRRGPRPLDIEALMDLIGVLPASRRAEAIRKLLET